MSAEPGVERSANVPHLDLLNTLAKDFTKEQAIKEYTDNAIQSTILFHHEQLTAAVATHLTIPLRTITSSASDEVLKLLANEMLHVSNGKPFLEAIRESNARDLSQLCAEHCPELSRHLTNTSPDSLEGLWDEMRKLAKPAETKPSVLLRFDFDPNERMLSCFDNGRGLDKEQIKAIMNLGTTAHGNEVNIGRGGKEFASHGTFCSGQFSSYGVGAKCGAASLCSPDNGKAVDGKYLVRSLSWKSGAVSVYNGSQDFKSMHERSEKEGENPWACNLESTKELTQEEESIMARPSWGCERITHIQVTGIDEKFCKNHAESADNQLALVSFLNDAYFPFFNDGVGTPAEPATRPLQSVQLTIEFLKGGVVIGKFNLGSSLMNDQHGFKRYPSIAEKGYPTAAEISHYNYYNIERERNSHNKEAINALIPRWGQDLTCRLEITLPGGGRAVGIFYFMPVLSGIADPVPWEGEHGLLVFQNGCRLPAQNLIVWPSFMKGTFGATPAAKDRRITLSTCFDRVIGLLFLPPSCSVTKNKSCLTPEAVLALNPAAAGIKAFVRQVPNLLGATAQALAAASAGPRHRAGTQSRDIGSTQELSSLVPNMTLENLFHAWLTDMRTRNLDISVTHDALPVSIPETDDFYIKELKYQRKPVRVGNLVRYRRSSDRTTPKLLGKLLNIKALGDRPGPGMTDCKNYRLMVECCSLSDVARKVVASEGESIPFDQIDPLKDLDVPEKEWKDELKKEVMKLPTSLELFGWNSKAGAGGSHHGGSIVKFDSPLGEQPTYICVAAVVANAAKGAKGAKGASAAKATYWPERLPLELFVTEEPTGIERSHISTNAKCIPHQNTPNAHFFQLRRNLLPPGSYKCTAKVYQSRDPAEAWLNAFTIIPAEATLTIVAGDPKIPWHAPHSRAPAGISLGAKLPELFLVCTDNNGYIVNSQSIPLVEVKANAEYGGKCEPVTVKAGKIDWCSMPVSDLDLRGAKVKVCGAKMCAALHLSGFELSGVKLPASREAQLKLSISVQLKTGTKKLEIILKSLGPGAPHELELMAPSLAEQQPLVLGGRTPQLRLAVRDQWGNAVSECGGKPLAASCDGEGVCVVGMSPSASGNEIRVPSCVVTADFGASAAIIVSVATGSGPPLTKKIPWQTERRFLAFHRKDEDAPVSELDWSEGGPIHGLSVRVHLPTGSAAVGPIDDQLNCSGVLEIRDSGKESSDKVPMTGTGGATAVLEPQSAPTKQEKTKTLTARFGGATAELKINWVQAPVGFKLELLVAAMADKKPCVVAGNPFKLRATVVDLDEEPYQTRSGQLYGWGDANELADLANSQPQELCVMFAHASDEEKVQELARNCKWAPQVPGRADATLKTVVLECELIIQCSGTYEITVDDKKLLQVNHPPHSAGKKIVVLAAAPARLRLAWKDGSSVLQVHQLKNMAQFGVRAEVIDAFDNVCTKTKGMFTLGTADDNVISFGTSVKGGALSELKVKGGSEVDWPELYLHGNLSLKFPLCSSLVAEFKAANAADIEIKALPLQLELTASGQPQRIEMERELYNVRVGETVEVRARVICDNGEVWLKPLKLFVDERVQGRHEASDWWMIPCVAPDKTGSYQLSVRVTNYPMLRQQFDMQVEPQSDIEDLDPEDTQLESPAPIPLLVSIDGGLAHNSGLSARRLVAPMRVDGRRDGAAVGGGSGDLQISNILHTLDKHAQGRPSIQFTPEAIEKDLKELTSNIKRLKDVIADAKRDLEVDQQKRIDLLGKVRGLVDADGTTAGDKTKLKRVLTECLDSEPEVAGGQGRAAEQGSKRVRV